MSRFLFVLVALTLPTAVYARVPGSDAVPPELQPAPKVLLAQVDDSDLGEEESLKEMIQEEIDKESWSMGSAIGLSLVPGGGFGLLYAEKPYASIVPFLLSAVGYGLGATYMMGVFDEDQKTVCKHSSGKVVDLEVCGYDTDPRHNHDRDPLSPDNDYYFNTASDYTEATVGENFDGSKTGLYIIAGTYAITTLLGAVWSGSTVADHNEAVRKDKESTTSLPRPMLGYDGDNGYAGFALDF